jgi:integrase
MEGCEGVVRYILERNKRWASFKARHEDHLRARLQGVLDDVAEDDVWLHEAEFSDNRFDEPEAWDLPMRSGEHLTELFRAYGDLRFDHQIQYADFKLEKRTAWLANIVVEIRLGTHTPAHKSPTVLEAGEAWIAQAETEGLERSTIVAYRQLLDLHVRPFLGHLKLAELTPGAVQNFRTVLIRNGRSRTMADRVVSGLGSILAEAMAGGRVARNVVREQAQHNRRRARVEKRHATRPQVLEHAGRLRPLLVTAVFTGLRASELRGLAWSAVDLDRKIVTVRQRADRCRTIGSPKSASAKREIPLASIGSTRRANGGWPAPRASSTWSSRTAKGGSNTTSTSIAGGSGRCRSPPGSRPTRGTRNGLHSLRHAAASLFIEQSFSPKRVQALMGHSTDVRSLARTAVASGQPRSRRNADLLALNPFREIPDRHPGDLRVRPWKTLSRRRKARGRGLPKRGTLV